MKSLPTTHMWFELVNVDSMTVCSRGNWILLRFFPTGINETWIFRFDFFFESFVNLKSSKGWFIEFEMSKWEDLEDDRWLQIKFNWQFIQIKIDFFCSEFTANNIEVCHSLHSRSPRTILLSFNISLSLSTISCYITGTINYVISMKTRTECAAERNSNKVYHHLIHDQKMFT